MTQSSIVFTAAGSGGHIFAAIATLKAFQSLYPTLAKELVFVGSNLTMEGEKKQISMEERLTMRLGIPFRKIRMGKLQRQFSLSTMKHLVKVVFGFIDSWKLIRELKPSVIVAFGGYVSLPLVIVGKMFGAKIVLHEQTSNIGLTNKLLQRFATTIAVTFETSRTYFKKQVVVVGSPTMPHMYTINDFDHLLAFMNKEKSRLLEEPEYVERLKSLYEKKGKVSIILMSGGSQGSHFLNEKMQVILPELLKTSIVILQTGENEYYNDFTLLNQYVKTLPHDLSRNCIVRKFVYEEYGYLMKLSDLFIGRSGANSVYQVGMNSLKAIFVPIPWVTRNEQYTNAMILKEKGYAEILEQDSCTPAKLLEVISQSLSEKKVEGPELPLFPLDADKKLAQEIGKLAL